MVFLSYVTCLNNVAVHDCAQARAGDPEILCPDVVLLAIRSHLDARVGAVRCINARPVFARELTKKLHVIGAIPTQTVAQVIARIFGRPSHHAPRVLARIGRPLRPLVPIGSVRHRRLTPGQFGAQHMQHRRLLVVLDAINERLRPGLGERIHHHLVRTHRRQQGINRRLALGRSGEREFDVVVVLRLLHVQRQQVTQAGGEFAVLQLARVNAFW